VLITAVRRRHDLGAGPRLYLRRGRLIQTSLVVAAADDVRPVPTGEVVEA
jgi:hypothetical protein